MLTQIINPMQKQTISVYIIISNIYALYTATEIWNMFLRLYITKKNPTTFLIILQNIKLNNYYWYSANIN